jgi:hypothetical protein
MSSLHDLAHRAILRRYINSLILLNYAFNMDPYISLALLDYCYMHRLYFTILKNVLIQVFNLIKALKILNHLPHYIKEIPVL